MPLKRTFATAAEGSAEGAHEGNCVIYCLCDLCSISAYSDSEA